LASVWPVLKIMFSTSVSGLIHFYVWWRLVHSARMPRLAHRILTALIVVMWLSIPITTSARLWAPSFATAFAWIPMPWMGFVGLSAVALIALEIPRRIARTRVTDPDRRAFLARVTGGTAAAVAGASVVGGMASARGEHQIVDVEVKLPKLPAHLDGFTIVQLSDLHTGLTIDRAFVQRVVDRANALSPDLIALTGDLVDGPVADIRDDIAPLAQLRAKHGVFAITGNHEYYAGVEPWVAEITRLGARYLRFDMVTIARGFDLAGVDDHSAPVDRATIAAFDARMAARDRSRPLVMLAHQPRQVRETVQWGADLQLSGHTHGGQIWPWHYIVRLQQGGLLAGHYEHEGTQVYVTRGCGYWGPPVRVLAPLEITRVILRTA
jgi:predicted MPP superfamily phosphohydrolase